MKQVQLIQKLHNVNFFKTSISKMDILNKSNTSYLNGDDKNLYFESNQEFHNNEHMFNKYIYINNMEYADFIMCDLNKTLFSLVNMDNVLFMNTKFKTTKFKDCTIKNSSFIDVEFNYIMNDKNMIDGSSFENCIFENIYFGGVNIFDSYFGNCTFKNCKIDMNPTIIFYECKFINDTNTNKE